jgi:hypothetical protein
VTADEAVISSIGLPFKCYRRFRIYVSANDVYAGSFDEYFECVSIKKGKYSRNDMQTEGWNVLRRCNLL